jgi:hypothetical protein
MKLREAVKTEILQGLSPLTQPPEHQKTTQNADQAEKANLTVLQHHELCHFVAPTLGRHEGHDAFKNKHQPERDPQRIAVKAHTRGLLLLRRWGAAATAATQGFEEVARWVDHHHVALFAERGFVGF